MERAAVVVVGGGIIGAAIAHHLTALGQEDVLVLDRELFFGMESTAKCAGGIRAQFSTEVNVRLSLESIRQFASFGAETGLPVDFRQVGYVFVSTTQAQWELARRGAAFQQALGVPVELLTPDRVGELCPELQLEDVVGGAYCPIDGLADPHGFLMGYHKRTRDAGGRILAEREVTGFRLEGDRVVAVETPQGPIACDQVVLAAGAWTGTLGTLLGVEIPIVPVRRQIATTAVMDWVDERWPMMVDNGSGVYLHPESGGLLMGMANKDEAPGFKTTVDEAFTIAIAEAAIARIPRLEEAAISAQWAGLYEVTPDHHPILGAIAPFRNAFVAAGFSGHGFMHAPAAGLAMAELMLGRAPFLDLDSVSLARFQGGQALHQGDEVMVI